MRYWSLFRVSDFDIRILESMISKKEVQHIAKLARLGLTEKEIEKYQKEFLKILDYIEKLKEVNVCRSQTSTSLLKSGSDRQMRKDEVLNFYNASEHSERSVKKRQSLFEQELIDGYLKVKSILK